MTDEETKQLLIKGKEKGIEMFNVGKARFLALSKKGKIIVSALMVVILTSLVTWIIPDEDFADPYKFVEKVVEDDMVSRRGFYDKHMLDRYEVLDAHRSNQGMIVGEVRFYPRKGAKYYVQGEIVNRRLNWFDYSRWAAEDVRLKELFEKVVKGIRDSESLRYVTFKESPSDEHATTFTVSYVISRRYKDGKWVPKHLTEEYGSGTYFNFDSYIDYLFDHDSVKNRAKELGFENVLYCDCNNKPETSSGKAFLRDYDAVVDQFEKAKSDYSLLKAKHNEFFASAPKEEFCNEVKPLLKKMVEILQHCPKFPKQ